MKLLRIVPDDVNLPFMGMRHIAFGVSHVLMAISVISILFLGFNFGIDFTGGTLVEARHKTGPVELSGVRTTLGNLEIGDVQVQEFGAPEDILIRLPQQEGGDAAQQVALGKVRDALGKDYEIRRVEVVGPSVSEDLTRDGAIAVIISLASVFLYLWFRFEWQFAAAGVLNLAHDLLITLGMLSLLQITFDLTILASVLTIIGYALNDTIVIYDRIRESLRKYKRMPLPDLINRSVNETLSRSVMTSLVTFLAALALFIFGGENLRGFNFTMLFGIVSGSFSTIFIASPLLILFKLRPEQPTHGDKTESKAVSV